jgi:hypothetical protein
MSETKNFSRRDVLTVTTMRLLTKPNSDRDNGIDNLYKLLNWMTNDELCTHQLPRAGKECQPWLLRWFPELNSVDVPETFTSGEHIESWLESLTIPESFDVPRIPRDGHDVINPLEELAQMVGREKIIVVQSGVIQSDRQTTISGRDPGGTRRS